MSIVYVNNFDKVIQKLSEGTNCQSGDHALGLTVTAAKPDYDPGVWAQIVPNGVYITPQLGPMESGTSLPKIPFGSSRYRPPQIVGPLPVHLDPGGLTLEVCPNPANGQALGSRTIYLPFNSLFLQGSGTIAADLVFDMPAAVSATDVWAVALNFKTGDQNDQATDQRMGLTCQFSVGGTTIKFHGSINNHTAAAGGYAAFAAYPPNQFRLSVELDIVQDVITGTGVGILEYSNGATYFSENLSLPLGVFKPESITAVGVAITTITPGFSTFSARLRSFSLSASPWLFALRQQPVLHP